MKISLLIAAIILGIAAIFAVPRHQKIKDLKIEWTELEIRAQTLGISSDPKTPSNSDRRRAESTRVAREKKITDFSLELIAFYHKMKASEKEGASGESKHIKEIAEMIEKIAALNPGELRLLVKTVSIDTTTDKESKLELIGFATMMLASKSPEVSLAIAIEARESLDAQGRENDHMLEIILQQYTAKDPMAAAQWLADNEEKIGPVPDHAKQRMIQVAARKDIGLAIGIIETLKLGEDETVFVHLSPAVTMDNVETFLGALRTGQASEEQRKNALEALYSSQLFKDFDSATGWLEKDIITDHEREIVIGSINYQSAGNEPEKWLSWLASSDELTRAQASATSNIIAGWTRTDFAATGEWINTQPDGAQKNDAIHTYAQTLAPHEPAAAADWALTLPKSEKRGLLLQRILDNYQQKDPEAAAAFAAKNGIKTY